MALNTRRTGRSRLRNYWKRNPHTPHTNTYALRPWSIKMGRFGKGGCMSHEPQVDIPDTLNSHSTLFVLIPEPTCTIPYTGFGCIEYVTLRWIFLSTLNWLPLLKIHTSHDRPAVLRRCKGTNTGRAQDVHTASMHVSRMSRSLRCRASLW